MPLTQCIEEGHRLRCPSLKPYANLVDSASKVHTNLSAFVHFNCHQHNASHRWCQQMKLPIQDCISPLFKKHHDVLHSFRIKSRFLYMASEALCILPQTLFSPNLLLPLPVIPEATPLSFIPQTHQTHAHLGPDTSYSACLENSHPNIKQQALSFHQLQAQFSSFQRMLS